MGLDVSRFPGDHSMAHIARIVGRLDEPLVLDIGANDGGYARELRAAGFPGRILSFEPLQGPFGRLAVHAAHDRNWRVINCALGASPGRVTMNVSENGGASSSVLGILPTTTRAEPRARYVAAEQVEVRRLDGCALWEGAGRSSLFLKVDVQGYEREVLKGSVDLFERGMVAGIQLELAMVPLYANSWSFHDGIEWLMSEGFRIVRIVPGFSDFVSGEMLQCDVVALREGLE